MKLEINMQMKLPKSINTLELYYNTYEKATYDQYLVATIFKACKGISKTVKNADELVAFKYIDELTGKGSLNKHFKQLYSKVRAMSDENLDKLLDSSLFPIVKIDKSNKYINYPTLGVSEFNNKLENKDLSNISIDEIKAMLMMNEDIFEKKINSVEIDKYERYRIKIEDDSLLINIGSEWINLPQNQLKEYSKKDDLDLNLYEGTVHIKVVEGNDWKLLTPSYLNDLQNARHQFLDKNKDCISIYDNYMKLTKIAKIHGIHIYMEEKIEFNSNADYCTLALKELYSSSKLNELKVKTIVNIMEHADELLSQECINYLLNRKDVKEIALLGSYLLDKGLERGWEANSLKDFITYNKNESFLNKVYKINANLFDNQISLILVIDDCELSGKHKKLKREYLNMRKNKIDEINSKIGEITTSGLRENCKKLKRNKDLDRFNKLCNSFIGHTKKNIESLLDDNLDKMLKETQEFYQLYLKVKDQYEKEINNA